MTPEQFAEDEYRDYVAYRELAKIEKNEHFRATLQKLATHEESHFQFWQSLAPKKEYAIHPLQVTTWKIMRKIMGLTFTVRFLERHETKGFDHYRTFLKSVTDKELQKKIEEVMKDESEHERILMSEIKEEKVEFIGSIILGLNDGLIELSGALVGFSFAFNNHLVVATTGIITGIAASLSMASSAYMQARHEENGKNPKKAALYTGISYIIVVILLVAPFIISTEKTTSLIMMSGVILALITGISYYTSIIFERNFKRQFSEMFAFSIGVALISFIIGSLVQYFVGVEI